MKTAITSILSALGLVAPSAFALAPDYQTDYELAQYPYIVLAQWDKAERRSHRLVEGDVCKRFEEFTELNVLRVVKGDLTPGRHTLLSSYGIAWLENGTGLSTGMSTEIPGDVDDVTKPNLWFLTRERSWNPSDKASYLFVPHYRTVQPPVLESFFVALASKEHDEEVPKLLASDNPEVITRVLRHLCGGVLPWPYQPEELQMHYRPSERGRLMKECAPSVRGLMARDVPGIRPLAASVYAELSGRDCVGFMRSLLADRDPAVRGIAVGVLAQCEDVESIARMCTAVKGLEDAALACAVIWKVAAWDDLRVAPVLIPFLEDDSDGGFMGQLTYIPALKAQKSLHSLTDCWFPFDIEGAQKAWAQAAALPTVEAQRGRLQALLPSNACPLRAQWSGPLSNLCIRVINASDRPVTICRYPTRIEANTSATMAHVGPLDYKYPRGRGDFIELQPGGAIRLQACLADRSREPNPWVPRLSFFYSNLGRAFGLKGWIGWVDVEREE